MSAADASSGADAVSAQSRRRRTWGQRLVIVIPYLWLALFFLLPFLIVVKISLSQYATAQPPYLPQLDPSGGLQALGDFIAGLSFENYLRLADDPLYLFSYGRSVLIALLSTAILLVIGFPIAYAMARSPRRWQGVLFMLIVLPFWTSFLIRVYAWMTILQRDGLLNQALLFLGLVEAPPVWISTDTAILIGIVYTYLPFMVLPLYASLERMDETLLEAAADLGCPRWRAFWLVTVPLALPGIAAGSLLCFIPIIGEFVIPDLLGGSGAMMIGQTLWLEFFNNRDWPVAAAVAVALLAILLVPLVFYQHLQARRLEREA
ncbi:MAG: ABC transporter permease [Hyphomicrobiales bacterium]|nr:ABC transporter permease [Hyphomicrobiales bacterium]